MLKNDLKEALEYSTSPTATSKKELLLEFSQVRKPLKKGGLGKKGKIKRKMRGIKEKRPSAIKNLQNRWLRQKRKNKQ